MTNQKIAVFPVKSAGIAIPDPTHIEKGKWTASCVVTRNFVADLRGHVEFRSRDHT